MKATIHAQLRAPRGLARGSITRATTLLSLLASATLISGQKISTQVAETHPSLSWSKCGSTGCTTQAGKIVLDVSNHPLHTSTGVRCWTSDGWVLSVCPPNDSATCTSACYVDGADYAGSYGVSTSGSSVKLNYVTNGPVDTFTGSRVYLMDPTDTKYQLFKLLNKEIAFDVDTSQLPCGVKGSFYFVGMDEDGGKARFGAGVAGAKYGTGYCDAKCGRDTLYINGQANTLDWAYDPNGPGQSILEWGNCCGEIDLWNANSISTQMNILPCTSSQSPTKCITQQENCNGEYCDASGCDFNPYRMGAKTFYGPGKTVNTNSKFTVVTQFITDDGTDNGNLSQVKRIYVQNGVVIQNAVINVPTIPASNVITDAVCSASKPAFGETDSFQQFGGLSSISETMKKGMVLAMSISDDEHGNLLWLDSNYPIDGNPATPGVARGTCSTSSGNPNDVRGESPNASVTFSNIKLGEIGGTGVIPVSTPATTTTTTSTTTTTTPAATGTCSGTGLDLYAQCGGFGYTGPGTCRAPYICSYVNAYYSQCIRNESGGVPHC